MTTSAPILMYHRIGTPRRDSIVAGQYVTAALFEKQLRFLQRRGYAVVALDDFVRQLEKPTPGAKPVAITFDDGYESFHAEALPVLERVKATATVFVVSGQIGKTNAWDEAKGDVTERMMTAEQIVDAARRGMQIGSHTVSHPDLLTLDAEVAEREVRDSKKDLEAVTGNEVGWLSYPYGRETEAIRGLVRAAGYRGACGTSRALNTAQTDLYSLARINIRASTSIPWLYYKLVRARREAA
jgi:peptidoglycan/xylan/chitin deacetylase (PgdA/CDA1 family)